MILSSKKNIYFSACRPDGGIYHCKSDGNGNINVVKKYDMPCPMYIITDGGRLYCILRDPFGNGESGLVSFRIKPDGSLDDQSEILSTKGEVACHLTALDGRIYCANYVSGSVIAMPDKLVTHSGKSIHPTRQTSPHVHFVCPSPDDKYIFAVDLGVDKIFVYTKELDFVSSVDIPAGHGARHLLCHSDGKTVFCVNELTGTVCVLKYDNGNLTLTDTVATLPEDFTEKNTAAAIRYSEGKLYVSHRGHDSIAVLDWNGEKLSVEAYVDVKGKAPRDIWVDEEAFICTCQDSDSVTVISRKGELLLEIPMECPISVLVTD